MNIWIYSDEKHEQYFVFAGVIFLSDDDRQSWIRKYRRAEDVIIKRHGSKPNFEVKAAKITNTP